VDQRIAVNLDWWNARLAEWRLQGGPVFGRGVSGTTVTGRAAISRGDILVLARDRDAAASFGCHGTCWRGVATSCVEQATPSGGRGGHQPGG
jgi:hypothetical protein